MLHFRQNSIQQKHLWFKNNSLRSHICPESILKTELRDCAAAHHMNAKITVSANCRVGEHSNERNVRFDHESPSQAGLQPLLRSLPSDASLVQHVSFTQFNFYTFLPLSALSFTYCHIPNKNKRFSKRK